MAIARSADSLSIIMETVPGSTAPGHVISSSAKYKAVIAVDENRALMCYTTAMQIVAGWLDRGLITEKDYLQIDTIMAEKFGVSTRSIWHRNNLMFFRPGGNMPATKACK